MKEYFVDGGFAQVRNNDVSILTQRAVPTEQIVRADAENALAAAEAMKITDDASFQARQDALQRARVQLQMAKK
jgi:F-type H+-transporting ATPase subunit epsilon